MIFEVSSMKQNIQGKARKSRTNLKFAEDNISEEIVLELFGGKEEA